MAHYIKIHDLGNNPFFADQMQLVKDLDIGAFKVYGIPLGNVHTFIEFAQENAEDFEQFVNKKALLSGELVAAPTDEEDVDKFIEAEFTESE
jgi:hypothetical protein